jgi:hypothetical protein
MIKAVNTGRVVTVHQCSSRQEARNNFLGVAFNAQRLSESSNQAGSCREAQSRV